MKEQCGETGFLWLAIRHWFNQFAFLTFGFDLYCFLIILGEEEINHV